jgi:anaerobic magnesium-protoporphyrin IX monomethyl ester cyclase
MKIVLISPHGSLIAYGLRQIAACLKEAGHEICMVFLPFPEEIEPLPGLEKACRYPENILRSLCGICGDAGLVGISCATNHFERLAVLSDHLRSNNADVPVIWGGIHPSVSPEECLGHADYVCRGEGELAMLELAEKLERGGSGREVRNLCWMDKDSGRPVINPLRPFISDLDSLPYPLYETGTSFIMHKGELISLTPPLACWHLSDGYSFGQGSAYHILATRGCPHSCAYCCNSFYSGIYDGWNRVRRYSNRRIVEEICHMREKMPFIDKVAFMDDTFFAASHESIEEFSMLYKDKVSLPFFACSSPSTLDKRRMDALVPAGLRYIWIGMQTGSRRIQKIYHRNNDPEVLVRAGNLLAGYRGAIRAPVFDFIIDPLFQKAEDRLDTLKLLERIGYPFQLSLYSMTFFPGTEITKMAEEAGSAFRSPYKRNMVALDRCFFRVCLWAYSHNLNRSLLKMCARPFIFRCLDSRWLKWLWWTVSAWLDRRERKQLIDWTRDHRCGVIRKNFPGIDCKAISPEIFS